MAYPAGSDGLDGAQYKLLADTASNTAGTVAEINVETLHPVETKHAQCVFSFRL